MNRNDTSLPHDSMRMFVKLDFYKKHTEAARVLLFKHAHAFQSRPLHGRGFVVEIIFSFMEEWERVMIWRTPQR